MGDQSMTYMVCLGALEIDINQRQLVPKIQVSIETVAESTCLPSLQDTRG